MFFAFRTLSLRILLSCMLTSYVADVTFSVSLNDFVCRKKPELCDRPDNHQRSPETRFLSSRHRHLPSDFSSWDDYGKTVPDGTGYGPGVGPQFHPGLGEVDVRTGIGIQHPFGSLAYRRDLEVGFGGSGRIGGKTIGFGEGYGNNGDASGLPGWPHPPPLLG